ncbi:MAG: T9SS type A sorting domain-containing protein [Candidatus Eisenbacteria bacterium]|nr:T9SS type A sorting domain-containing protein [Candidatus Eisenbacteria bacterium]
MKGRRFLLGLCILFSSLFHPSTASALTRDEILATAKQYRDLTYNVNSINVYPGNQSGCYTSSCRNTVPVGSGTGMAYSYGNWHTPDEFTSNLTSGRGAGNYPCMNNYSCYYNHMTGIDCSGLVGRAWGITGSKPGTWHLSTSSYSVPIDTGTSLDTTDIRKGDVLDRTTSPAHVMLLNYWNRSNFPRAWIIHSNISDGRVREVEIDVRTYLREEGYKPYRSNDIKDDPLASLLWIGSDSTGTIAWETGWEKETEGFVVHRLRPDGTAEPISDLLPARGSVERGDRYSFLDGSFPGPQTIYRLQEVETSGNTIWLGKTSAADGIPSAPAWQPPVVSLRETPSAEARGAGNCLITNPSYPQNQNLEWIAVCADEWEDALAPLVAYRESQNLSAGVWTVGEVFSCWGDIGPPFIDRNTLRDLLANALAEWTVKPKYLLLVGDAYYLGGDADRIPMWGSYEPELAWFDEDSTWSDRPYADPDGDGVAEIFVGRIPATSAADVSNAVAKILERENSSDPTYGKRSLLFVEDSGDCGNDAAWIRALADSVNACLPTDWSRTLIARSAIGGTYNDWERVADSAWSAGQGLVFFFGNCSGWWSFNDFWNTAMGWDSGKLSPNHVYPFVFGGSCGEGGIDRRDLWGIHRPILEQLLCSFPDRGASGGLLPTRSLHPYTAVRIAKHFIDRVFRGEPTLGSAAYHAMEDLLEVFPGAEDHVWEYVFFGDPAMRSLAPDVSAVAGSMGSEQFAFALEMPAPNPVSARGAIRFSLPAAADVDLKVYDLSGRVVKTILSGRSEAGRHSVEWDGTNERGRPVASGIYFLHLRSGDREAARKITLLR